MTTKPPTATRAEKISAAQKTAREAAVSARQSDLDTPPPAPDRARGWRGFTFSRKAPR